jgi:hypothetical protein
MHRLLIAALASAVLTASGPAFAGGEVIETEAARMNALAGGPVSERDAELLQRWGCYSGTPSAICHGNIRKHLPRVHRRAQRKR